MKPTTESFLHIQAVFYEALEVPEPQRAAWVEQRCCPDLELAAEVWSLA